MDYHWKCDHRGGGAGPRQRQPWREAVGKRRKIVMECESLLSLSRAELAPRFGEVRRKTHMKITKALLYAALVALIAGCNSGDNTANNATPANPQGGKKFTIALVAKSSTN